MGCCTLSPTILEKPINPAIISSVENTVKKTIEKYALFTPTEKILVAVSGGKDSTTCLHILKKLGYFVEAFTVDVHIGCYTKQNLERVKTFCAQEGVKLHVYSFKKSYGHSICYLRSHLNKKGIPVNSCTVCGVLRRRLFNMAAKQTGATKLVTGHTMDDEVQSILMNLFRNRQSLNARITPTPHIIDTATLVPRAKPLFFVSEDDIIQYSRALKFPVNYGRCPCSTTSLRSHIRDFVDACKQVNPRAVENILAFFLSTQSELIKNIAVKQKISTCTQCGEPTATDICRSCQLLAHLRLPTQTV